MRCDAKPCHAIPRRLLERTKNLLETMPGVSNFMGVPNSRELKKMPGPLCSYGRERKQLSGVTTQAQHTPKDIVGHAHSGRGMENSDLPVLRRGGTVERELWSHAGELCVVLTLRETLRRTHQTTVASMLAKSDLFSPPTSFVSVDVALITPSILAHSVRI